METLSNHPELSSLSHSERIITEAFQACESQIRELLSEHLKISKRWHAHEILPWGEGRDFGEEPWSQEQSPLSPEMATAFETHLLTEDNLPSYHSQIAKYVPAGSALAEWNGIWTSEEGLHSIVMRDYAHLMRVIDPVRLENNRLAIMREGFNRSFANPLELFAYTSMQELATRVSHLKLGQRAGEPVLLKLMVLISKDENFHYIFYRSIVKMMLEFVPDLMLPAILKQLLSFQMPGVGMSDFYERHTIAADLGIYGALEHRDLVIKPVLQFWDVEKLRNLRPETERVRERILRIPLLMDRLVEKQANLKRLSH